MTLNRLPLLLAVAWIIPSSSEGQTIDSTWTAGSRSFTFALFRKVVAGTQGPNVALSPLGAQLLVGLAANGARDETQAEMLNAVASGMDADAFNGGARALHELVRSQEGAQYSIANSIWVHHAARLQPTFETIVREAHRGEVATVDFRTTATVDRINRWVSQETAGRIPTVVAGPLRADLAVLLLNAVYFKGDWAQPFDSTATRKAPFFVSEGLEHSVDMMSRTGMVPYAKVRGATAVRLHYQSDRLSAYVVLPDSSWTAKTVVSELLETDWFDSLGAALVPTSVRVRIPRFEMEGSYALKSALREMGVQKAFGAQADFRALAMAGPGLRLTVGDVSQKTFLKVDEIGTEAAATTLMEIVVTGLAPPPVEFTVDRPFLFVVVDSVGIIPFVALIGEPTALH